MFSQVTVRNLLVAALCAGLAAGLLLSILQSIQVIPTLLQAEVYEKEAGAANSEQFSTDQIKVNTEQQKDAVAWRPRNGWERTFFTAISNICIAVGFALLLGAVSHFRGGMSRWYHGLLWGLAGYITFFVAPSLCLPPELPGTEAADLNDRQLWWFITVFDTAAGLWLLVFAKNNVNKIFGVILLMSPHVLGAPQSATHSSAAPAELVDQFIAATAFANVIFWLTLGAMMGLFSSKGKVARPT